MGAIFKEAWRLYRENFFLLSAIMLTIWIPGEIFLSWMNYSVFGEDDLKHGIQLQRFLDNFFGIIAISGIYYLLRERNAQQPVSYGAALGAGFRFWGPLWATRFVIWAGILACLLAPMLAFGFLVHQDGYAGLILGGIIGSVLGTYLYIRMSLCEAVVVAEEVWGLEAARRSHHLTKGKFWRILAWLIIGCLPPFLVAMAIYLPTQYISFTDNWIGDSIGSILADIPLVFCFCIVWAVYIRLSKEEINEDRVN